MKTKPQPGDGPGLLGKRLKELRQQRRLTQEKLARKSGLHVQFVGAIERGKANPTLKVLQRIAQALKVPMVELFRYQEGGEDPKEIRRILGEAIERCTDAEVLRWYRLYGFR